MKDTQRRKMRAMLRAMEPELRRQKAADACRRLIGTAAWREARTVFVYLSMDYEIDTTPLVEAAWRDGKQVCAPRVANRAAPMVPARLRDWTDCLPGFRGIPEPLGEAVAPAAVDLVVVPGLAFDHRGFRLGQGGGHYDRFLADPEVGAQRCGFAFEEQVVAELQVEPHDQRVHQLVTDAASRAFG